MGETVKKPPLAAQETLQIESQLLSKLESARWILRWSVVDKWSSLVDNGWKKIKLTFSGEFIKI